jgi:sulfite exporter TauE/SafE
MTVVDIAPLHLGGGVAGEAGLVVFFLVGLLGGAHCIGMCGPLVTMYSKQLTAATDERGGVLTQYEVRQHALFNLGRTVSYATLGGVFGVLGGLVFDVSGTINAVDTPLRAAMGILVGGFILFVGGRYVLGDFGSHGFFGSGPLSGIYRRLTAHVEEWVNGPGIFGLGLAHGLLPCPLLYPAFLYAFASGSALGGTLALGALGVGTFPTVFLYGTVIQSVDATHRTRLHRLLGVAFLIMGWMPLAHGLSLYGIRLPHVEPPIYQPLFALL